MKIIYFEFAGATNAKVIPCGEVGQNNICYNSKPISKTIIILIDFLCDFSEVLLEPNTKKLIAGNGIGIADESSTGPRMAIFTNGTCLKIVSYSYFRFLETDPVQPPRIKEVESNLFFIE